MPETIRNILVVHGEKDAQDLLKDFPGGNNVNIKLADHGVKDLELSEENIPGIAIFNLPLPPEHGLRRGKIDSKTKKQKLTNQM